MLGQPPQPVAGWEQVAVVSWQEVYAGRGLHKIQKICGGVKGNTGQCNLKTRSHDGSEGQPHCASPNDEVNKTKPAAVPQSVASAPRR